jgi:hypothetical protein
MSQYEDLSAQPQAGSEQLTADEADSEAALGFSLALDEPADVPDELEPPAESVASADSIAVGVEAVTASVDGAGASVDGVASDPYPWWNQPPPRPESIVSDVGESQRPSPSPESTTPESAPSKLGMILSRFGLIWLGFLVVNSLFGIGTMSSEASKGGLEGLLATLELGVLFGGLFLVVGIAAIVAVIVAAVRRKSGH